MKTTIILILCALIITSCISNRNEIYRDPYASIDLRVEDLLGRMTPEEKVAQTLFVWQMLGKEGEYKKELAEKYASHGLGGLHRRYFHNSPEEAAREMNEIQRFFVEETRLGIPVIMNTEGNHGVMTRDVTILPSSIGLASSWNEALFSQLFSAVAKEGRAMGMHQFFSPNFDIVRDPRWGRTDENYGEDPYLTAQLGVSFIRAIQGKREDIEHLNMSAVAKHFIGHGLPEGGVNTAPGNISRNEIMNAFLPPFEAAVKETGVTTIMLSYNEVDGVPATINPWLVRDVLRGKLGYDGVIMSDYNAIPQLQNLHFVAGSREEAARLSLENGVDVDLSEPPQYCYPALVDLIRSGEVDETLLNESVRKILTLKFRLGLFDDPYTDISKIGSSINTEEHQALALEAAHESMVLLKNENALLPLNPASIGSIAVIGPNADTCQYGNYAGTNAWATTVLEGMIEEFGAERVRFAQGCHLTRRMGPDSMRDVALWDRQENLKLIREAVQVARKCDVIVLALGSNTDLCREAGWANSSGDRSDLNLAGEQNELVEAMLATGKPVIVLLFNGRPLSFTYVKEHVPAIIECWHPGQATGQAVADLLVGRMNFSGKLPITFPASVGHLPSYYNRKPTAKIRYVIDTREYLYPFGYGLSYTSFEYGKPLVKPSTISPGENAIVSVEIVNSGPYAGQEIAQMYIRDRISSVTRPVKELKGFKKIHLEPGESKTVEFEITPDKLSFYNAESEWILEPGKFYIMTGPNSVQLDTANLTVH